MSAEVENKTGEETIKVDDAPAKKIDDSPVKEPPCEKAEAETKSGDDKKEEGEGKAEKKEAAPPPPRVHKQDFQKDVVYLYQFCRTPVLPSLSPYCLKVETWLRLTEVQYEVCFYKKNSSNYKFRKNISHFIAPPCQEYHQVAPFFRKRGPGPTSHYP